MRWTSPRLANLLIASLLIPWMLSLNTFECRFELPVYNFYNTYINLLQPDIIFIKTYFMK